MSVVVLVCAIPPTMFTATKINEKGKTAGPNTITIELMECLDEFGIDIINNSFMFNNKYMTAEEYRMTYQYIL